MLSLFTRSGKETAMQQNRWQTKVGMIAVSSVAVGVVAGLVLGMNSAAGASAGGQTRAAAAGGIPRGYAQVDPRNPAGSRQSFPGQPLRGNHRPLHPELAAAHRVQDDPAELIRGALRRAIQLLPPG